VSYNYDNGNIGDYGAGLLNGIYDLVKSSIETSPLALAVPQVRTWEANHLPGRLPIGNPNTNLYATGNITPTIAALFAGLPETELGAGVGLADDGAVAAARGDDATIANRVAASCGGMSFTAATRVLLAHGKSVPISELLVGDKVIATDTRTGRTRPETVTAVLVHYDTNLYDLRVQTPHGAAIIGTSSTHLFWSPAARRWVKAAELKQGARLRSVVGGAAIIVGGDSPDVSAGWMWDLTVARDHDFYVASGPIFVLVHNTTCTMGDIGKPGDIVVLGRQADTEIAEPWTGHLVLNDPAWTPAGNIAWIKNAMAAGRSFYLSSPMTFNNLWDGVAMRPTVYQLELNAILDPGTGYEFSPDGQYLVPGTP
jgi:Pretoxin HINT domain